MMTADIALKIRDDSKRRVRNEVIRRIHKQIAMDARNYLLVTNIYMSDANDVVHDMLKYDIFTQVVDHLRKEGYRVEVFNDYKEGKPYLISIYFGKGEV